MEINPALTRAVLEQGAMAVQGKFVFGSNSTYFVNISHQGKTYKAVYKPIRGERPLWDFPHFSLANREVAAYLLSEQLGWDLVPTTVMRKKAAPLGKGSLQLYISHDLESHYFNFTEDQRSDCIKVVLFDVIVNNADRKAGHLFFDDVGRLWAIDHGLCFHEQDKLRTVLWEFAGQPIPGPLLSDVKRLANDLKDSQDFIQSMSDYLTPSELGALRIRLKAIIESAVFPQPQKDRRSYPWPPV